MSSQRRKRDNKKSPVEQTARVVPFWDRENQKLWWNGEVIMEFERAATFEEKLLNAFQDAGWPDRVPNPYLRGHRAKQDAHNACRLLSARQSVIRFRTRNSGQQISWELRRD